MQHLPPIDQLLRETVAASASDLHLKVGLTPTLRINGDLVASEHPTLRIEDTEAYLQALIPDRLLVEFKECLEADFAHGIEGHRFRVNAYRQRGTVTIAIRSLLPPPGDFAGLGLPPVLDTLVAEPRGLILVTGPTGSGKTTTLAAMVDAINRTRRVNVITVEDPIEVVHDDRMAMISQREVGVDTGGFSEALRRVLRQDPDVIVIGEMRDAITVESALQAAETGHLVLSSLHTLDAAETINRILDFFPAEGQRQVRLLLAGSLRGVLSQRLIPADDGRGRVPAVEVLVNTDRVAERISDPARTHEIIDVITDGSYYGMETFDQAILRLVGAGAITLEQALRHATSPADVKLRAQQMGLIET